MVDWVEMDESGVLMSRNGAAVILEDRPENIPAAHAPGQEGRQADPAGTGPVIHLAEAGIGTGVGEWTNFQGKMKFSMTFR